jgi:hypothetical protein
MNKKLILFSFFLFFLFAISGRAALDSSSVVYVYEMDEGAGTETSDSSGNYTNYKAKIYNTTTWDAADFVTGGQSLEFDGNDNIVANYSTIPVSSNKFSLSIWFKSTLGTNLNFIWHINNGLNDDRHRAWLDFNGLNDRLELFYQANDAASSTIYATNSSFKDGNWHMATVVVNATNVTLYVDSAKYSTFTAASSYADLDFCFDLGNEGSQLCTKSLMRYDFTGNLDQYIVWNKALSNGEIADLWNGGSGIAYPFGGGGGPGPSNSLNISTPQPLNNTIWNTEAFTINATMNTTAVANCSLWMDGVLNATSYNHPAGTNVFVGYNLSFGATEESNHSYILGCWNGINSTNTSTYNFWIDNVLPNIAWYVPHNHNKSFYHPGNLTMFSNITLTDPNLYSYVYNISYSNGTVIRNWTNSSLTGKTIVNITEQFNLSNLTGNYIALLKVCDGHTSNRININPGVENNELRFDSLKLYLQTKADTNKLEYQFAEDRYKFSFATKAMTNTLNIVVESPEYIDILHGKSEFKGHLVTGKYWIDFENPDLNSVSFTRINDKKLIVHLQFKTSATKFSFNSVGELNCLTEERKFFVYNYSDEEYDSVALATVNSIFFLNVTDYNYSYLPIMLATLNYNGSKHEALGTNFGTFYQFNVTIPAPTFSSTENVSFYWNYTFGNDYISYNRYYSDQLGEHNQTVYYPAMDNCTLYNTPWINFTLKDEDSGGVTIGQLDYIFSWQLGNITGSYSGETSNVSSFYSFCMFPAFANFSSNASIDYALSPDSSIRTYTGSNLNVDNVTEQQDLLLLSEPTDITFHVIDDSDNNLQGILIKAYRYNVANNTDELVASEYTDQSGIIVLGLKKAATYYRFEFYQDSVLALSTTRFKLFSTSYEFVLGTVEPSLLAELVNYRRLTDTNLTFDNSTMNVQFDYYYSGGLTNNTFCLKVEAYNATNYFTSCSSNTTGTFNYIITQTNITYLATGYVLADDGNQIILKTLGIDTTAEWRKWGEGIGLTISFIVLLTTSLLGLVNVDMAIVSTTLAMSIIIYFGLIPLSSMWIIPLMVIAAIMLFIVNRRKEV